MVLEEPTQIRYVNRVDLSGVKDAGIASIILLAVSLGWNFTKRANGPLLIIARDGTTRRLPTDTSVRMSVFQSALSTVMVHTEPEMEATIDLIDKILEITKPSKDHERRLRLAVGETVQQHRDRIASLEAEPQGPREPQPVMQRIEVPATATDGNTATIEWTDEALAVYEPPAVEARDKLLIPHDGKHHGQMVRREPFLARHQGSKDGRVTRLYQSDSSLERKWQDGYVDYECTVCGRAYATPKGVGSHRQYHIKDGEIPRTELPAYKRTELIVESNEPYERKVHRRSRAEILADQGVEFVDELPPEGIRMKGGKVLTDADIQALANEAERGYDVSRLEAEPPTIGYADIVSQIGELILPHYTERYEARIAEQQAEIDRLNEALDKIQKDWNALKELLSGR